MWKWWQGNHRGGYCYISPNHVLEHLTVIDTEDILYISNSVAFALKESGCALDINYLDYEKDFSSIVNGLSRYQKSIPLDNGNELILYYYCNLYIDKDFAITQKPKCFNYCVQNYNEYINSLNDSIRLLVSNAKDKNRAHRYGIVTTVSTGYDSSACATLAKNVGCDLALTFNAPEKYENDSGTEVAKELGYSKIITANANHYLNSTELTEAFHTCSGELGSSIVFEAFEGEFKNNIVFHGERGDKLWNKNWSDVNNDFRFVPEAFAGISMAEWRLNVGFILLPPPLFGAEQWEAIDKISNSEEMKPWSVGGSYDRPIPRRLCEENGVSRGNFGQRKKGAGFNYKWDTLSRVKTRMSPVSFESFYEYYTKNKRKGEWHRTIRFIIMESPKYFSYVLNKIGIEIKHNQTKNIRYNPGAPSYLINWGMEIAMKKY